MTFQPPPRLSDEEIDRLVEESLLQYTFLAGNEDFWNDRPMFELKDDVPLREEIFQFSMWSMTFAGDFVPQPI